MANRVVRIALGLLLLALAVDCQRPARPTKTTSKAATPFKAPAPAAKDDELTDECPEPNGYFADGFQCDKYYECIEGAITEKLCPDGMVFNDYNIQVEKCDLPFNIDCSTRPELQTPKPTLHCPRMNGYFAHEEANVCNQFYFCVDGKFNMIVCPDGLVYNERTGICTWPDEAKKKGCSSQGTLGNNTITISPEQSPASERAIAKRAKRYSVREYSSESEEPRVDDHSEEDEHFQFKDQAELEKVVEEGYGKDYEDGLWVDPNAPPSGEEEMPEDYDSADYEDKRAEEDSGSAADTSASVENSASVEDSPDFVDSVEPPEDDKNFLFSVGSIFGDRMLLDADGFPLFDNKYGSSDLRSVWAKKDLRPKDNFKDYGNYYESEARASGPQNLNTTTAAPSALQASSNSTSNSTNATISDRIDKTTESAINTTEVFKFSCPEVGMSEAQQHPRYADPDDCQFFYVCIDGKIPRRNGCKKGQVFNEVSKNCDWPRNVNECKEWYKGILTDAELEALENPRPKNRTTEYKDQASRRRGAGNRKPAQDD